MKKSLEFLLDHACPSIRYRLKKEILGDIDSCEEEKLQGEILEDVLIQDFLARQNPDGWIDEDFHSEKGVESAIRVFSEKGVLLEHPSFQGMLNELEIRADTFDKFSLFRVGKILDEKGFGGSQLMRAAAFAYAGIEDKDFIQEQIEKALNKFQFVISVDKIQDITEVYKGKRAFIKDAKWPSIYDLRILAFSKSWRCKENEEMITSSIRQLINLSPIPDILVRKGSQLISPASICMHDFNQDMNAMKDGDWMAWFHRMEMLSRLGVVKKIEELKAQVNSLVKMLDENDGLFVKRMSHYYFHKWSAYTGLALEKDWRSEKRRICDLTFRSLLILHYSEMGNTSL